MRRVLHVMVAMMSMSAWAAPVITTPEVIASSACPACIDYQVVGLCQWLTCTPVGCSTSTTVKVRHRLPETVVMAYPEVGNAPWQPVGLSAPSVPMSKDGGSTTRRSVQGMDSPSLSFQNVDIIGHPGLDTVYEVLAGTGFFLNSTVQSLMPYYLSVLDPLGWRWNLPDRFNPHRLNLLANRLGNLGSIYPRGGFATQPHPVKSAILAAYRAEHVVTRLGESRVYQSVAQAPRRGFWPPEPLTPTSEDTWFQRLYPDLENQAHLWPEFDDTLMLTDPYAKHRSDSEQYVWAVWRTYTGCQRGGQTLLFHTGGT